jgi:hypothetical protein
MKFMKKIKIPIIVVTAAASVIGVVELRWLKAQESIEFEKWEFAAYMLPWLCMSAGFLALLYLNLFSSQRATGSTRLLLKIGFVVVTIMVLTLWITMISRFIP